MAFNCQLATPQSRASAGIEPDAYVNVSHKLVKFQDGLHVHGTERTCTIYWNLTDRGYSFIGQ